MCLPPRAWRGSIHAKAVICTVVGLDGQLVEVDIASYGMPSFTIVGLPDAAIQEAKEQVRTKNQQMK